VLWVEVVAHEGIVEVLYPVDLDDTENFRIVESDEDALLYDIGHIPNSVKMICDPLCAHEGIRVGVTFILYLPLKCLLSLDYFLIRPCSL